MRTKKFELIPGQSIHHRNWNFVANDLTEEQCEKVRSLVCNNYMPSKSYQLGQKCSPFLQGYRPPYEKDGANGWVFVEFWSEDKEAMMKFVDFINEEMGFTG